MPAKAVVLAAGMGARLCPLTPFIPKEMLPVAGLPAIHHVLFEALSAGVKQAMIVLSPEKTLLRDYLTGKITPKGETATRLAAERERVLSALKIEFALQKKPLGTADAVYLAKDFAAKDPLLVMYSDDVLFVKGKFESDSASRMVALSEKTSASVILSTRVPGRVASQYGVLQLKNQGGLKFVTAICEKPQGYEKREANVMIGRMVLTPDAVASIPAYPYSDSQGIVPALGHAAKEGGLLALKHVGKRYDVGSHEGYLSLLKEV